ncbi:class I SAM-dependent methyltransferase [Bacillus sp. FJAT-44742]|uniref:class I SAM-dependent methyltransferase n=1 Tax=Bacillus sp. FJAT-44742 TaxID=2014005 RepID=UPI000C24195B|nr:class I SAM-dependent methyltransferase [Bacillus sp. FJAT-44742]
MNLYRILPFARHLIDLVVRKGDIAVDATAGNGHDTLYLAERTGESGRVYSFDIQPEAIQSTKERLKKAGLEGHVTLLQQSHCKAADVIPNSEHSKLKAAIFNLGYLPGGDKTITTSPQTTITAVKNLLRIMPDGGLIILVIYHGHAEGQIERDKLLSYTESLDQQEAHVLRYQFTNQMNNPPFIVTIEKRG